MNLIANWFRRHFSDPQVVILAVFLVIGSAVVFFFGKMLAPVLASVVIAYLLQGPVGALERHRVPRLVSVLLVFLTFVVFLLFLLLLNIFHFQEPLILYYQRSKFIPLTAYLSAATTLLDEEDSLIHEVSTMFIPNFMSR